MISAPIPVNEQERLEELYRYCILDTPFEQSFDEIAHLAARICNTPVASVTIIDRDRQWFKAITGLNVRETPREISFCAHTILGDDIFEVSDTLKDERFFDNPLVTGEPFIRFYAGFPLRTQGGFNCGTICITDVQPRSLTTDQKFALTVLGKRIVQQMEYDRKEKQLKDIDNLFGRHHINVLDSINFGEKIHKRLVFQQSDLQEKLKESFVLFRQRTLLSNTFSFLKEYDNCVYLAQYECGKEGFAGLYLGSVLDEHLSELIEKDPLSDPGGILYQLNKSVKEAVLQSGIVSTWTLNIGLCRIDKRMGTMEFSGAGKSLFVISGPEQGTKAGSGHGPFGYRHKLPAGNKYPQETIDLQKGSSFYLVSGGLAEQKGAEGAFGEDRLLKLLCRTHNLPMDMQASVIWDVVDNWKGSFQQQSDILCLGFKL